VGGLTGRQSLEELRALPTARILDAVKSKGMTDFSPVIDGRLLTEPVPETYAPANRPMCRYWLVGIAMRAALSPCTL